jgi:hypothetical protein
MAGLFLLAILFSFSQGCEKGTAHTPREFAQAHGFLLKQGQAISNYASALQELQGRGYNSNTMYALYKEVQDGDDMSAAQSFCKANEEALRDISNGATFRVSGIPSPEKPVPFVGVTETTIKIPGMSGRIELGELDMLPLALLLCANAELAAGKFEEGSRLATAALAIGTQFAAHEDNIVKAMSFGARTEACAILEKIGESTNDSKLERKARQFKQELEAAFKQFRDDL